MTMLDVPYQLGYRSQLYKPFKISYRQYQTIKRFFDMIFCLFLLPIILVPMAIIALVIMLDSPGSPIFVQERIGYMGHRFKIYKFRTMKRNHDEKTYRSFMQTFVSGKKMGQDVDTDRVAKFKPIQSKDVTRVGGFLRKTSLDELPQIFNILKGEMSLVGPRPNVPWEVEAYKPWHRDRLSVLPGITGLAQVMGRSEISFDNIARFDIQYAKNQALHLDYWIMWRTISVVFEAQGAG